MTTKRDIIDILEKIEIKNFTIVKIALLPWIKVDSNLWGKEGKYLHECIGWEAYDYKIKIKNSFSDDHLFIAVIKGKEIPRYTLKDAQEICQKHYEKSILESIEYSKV